jgi:hypothetical protein
MNGKRCFIVGNGPSLTSDDLNLLKAEDCFASNSIFNMFVQTEWRPKYYVLVDRYACISVSDIIDSGLEYIFLGSYRCRFNSESRYLLNYNNVKCIRSHQTIIKSRFKFSYDIMKCAFLTNTVSYIIMQIAVYMGYSEIYLLGFDHNYGFEVNEKGNIVKNNNRSHFYSDNNKVVADIEGMTLSYNKMKEVAEKKGIKVYNATRGGKLEVFERIDFDSLFA